VILMCGGATRADERIPFPEPKYTWQVERNVRVPMRDGVHLATDLYRPLGAGKRLPVILIRTQYDKQPYFDSDEPFDGVAKLFAGQGFLVAVQDIRGRFASEGQYRLGLDDAKDGYDAVDWRAKQPWSNGRIGTYGSYVAFKEGYSRPLMEVKLGYVLIAVVIGAGAAAAFVTYELFRDGKRAAAR
jgi:predicted acyl esterase